MLSTQEIIHSEGKEIPFNIIAIEYELSKKGNESIFNYNENCIFKLLEVDKSKVNTINEKEDYPKFFAQIKNNNFQYIGILSNTLKRDSYGYNVFENGDEYLGNYSKAIKNGFGIYISKLSEKERDLYIGEFKDNKRNGQGIYIKIYQNKENSIDILNNYFCCIGSFEQDIFKGNKIFFNNNNRKVLYIGKLNDFGFPDDKEGILIEQGKQIIRGVFKEGLPIEGRKVFIKENGEKDKGHYFLRVDSSNDYNFDFSKGEEKDNEIIDLLNKSNFEKYKENIQELYNKITKEINLFQSFQSANTVNFENDIKNDFSILIEKLIS